MPGLLGTFPTWVGMQTETTNRRVSKIRKLLDMLSAKEKRIMGQGELRPPPSCPHTQGDCCVPNSPPQCSQLKPPVMPPLAQPSHPHTNMANEGLFLNRDMGTLAATVRTMKRTALRRVE